MPPPPLVGAGNAVVKILVTGGSGFIGSAWCRQLVGGMVHLYVTGQQVLPRRLLE